MFFLINNKSYVSAFFDFIKSIIKSMLDCRINYPVRSFVSFFIFIFLINMCYFGYYRYSICICRYIEFTFFLSLSFWIRRFFFFISFEKFRVYLRKGGDRFLKSFRMMIIELVREFSRPIALTVRLTVNITVGHILVMSVFLFSESTGSFFYLIFIIFCIFMEFFVFFIQRYIFSRLIYLYLNE